MATSNTSTLVGGVQRRLEEEEMDPTTVEFNNDDINDSSYLDDSGLNDDNNDESSDEELEMDPNHPVLRRVQEALKRQLMARKQKAENDLKTKLAQVKDTKREREDVGVSLYGAQKVLAKAQTALENLQDESNMSHTNRIKSEEHVAQAKELHERMRTRQKEVQSQVDEARRKADSLRLTAQAVRDKAKQMESDLTSAIRQAEKAKKEEESAEISKQQQDLYVDRLGEVVKDKQNELKILTTHREAQSDMTAKSLARMNEAQTELELLYVERRETNQLWKASLLGLEKRSVARAKMREACRDQQQEVFSTITKVEKVKKELQEMQDKSEMLELRRRRLDKDTNVLTKAIASANSKAADTQQQYSMLTKALQEAEERLGRAKQGINIRTSENNAARQKYERLAARKQELDKEILAATYGKTALTKAGQQAIKTIKEAQRRAAEIEMRIHQVENKTSREEMKIQSFEHAINLSNKHLESRKLEIADKVKVLKAYEQEAVKTKVAIDKKENALELLERKIQTIIEKRAAEGAGRADVTPAELKRDELRDNINAVISENLQTQQKWLQNQSEYVALMQAIEADTRTLDELQTKNTVLSQKKARLQAEIEANTKELKQYQHSYSSLQSEVVKLNTLINKNTGVRDELESKNVLMESEFLRKLKEEELESIKIQEEVQDLVDEKVRLEHEIVDAEREILEWEKKIQLAQEMKDALTSQDDVNELEAMKKEIHRMRLRLDQLARQRELLISSMEKSVEQRGTIHAKAQASSKTRGAANHNAVKKDIIALNKRIKQSKKDANEAESNLVSLQAAIEDTEARLEESRAALGRLQEQAGEVSEELEIMQLKRAENLHKVVYFQNMYKHLSTAQSKKLMLKKSEDQYDTEIREQINQLQNLKQLLEYIATQAEEAAQPLIAIGQSVDTALSVPSLGR